MADMTFKDFCHQRELMCDSVRTCQDCGLYPLHRHSTKSCAEIMMEWPEKAEQAVKRWMASEDPEEDDLK